MKKLAAIITICVLVGLLIFWDCIMFPKPAPIERKEDTEGLVYFDNRLSPQITLYRDIKRDGQLDMIISVKKADEGTEINVIKISSIVGYPTLQEDKEWIYPVDSEEAMTKLGRLI